MLFAITSEHKNLLRLSKYMLCYYLVNSKLNQNKFEIIEDLNLKLLTNRLKQLRYYLICYSNFGFNVGSTFYD